MVGDSVSLNTAEVMEGLRVRLATITGLKTHAYPPDSLVAPAGVVHFPTAVEFDLTAQRGKDAIEVEVSVLVGKVSDRTARTRLGAYLAGSGASSVKAAIEGGKTLGGAADTTRVRSATVSTIAVEGVDYLSASFEVHVVG